MSSLEQSPSRQVLTQNLYNQVPSSVASPSKTMSHSPDLKRKRPVEAIAIETPTTPAKRINREPRRTFEPPSTCPLPDESIGIMPSSPRRSPAKKPRLPTIFEADTADEDAQSRRISSESEEPEPNTAGASVTTGPSEKPLSSDEEDDSVVRPKKTRTKRVVAVKSEYPKRPSHHLCQCEHCIEQLREGQCFRMIVGSETVCRPCAYGCYVGAHPDAN